jgi:hypothetical protein
VVLRANQTYDLFAVYFYFECVLVSYYFVAKACSNHAALVWMATWQRKSNLKTAIICSLQHECVHDLLLKQSPKRSTATERGTHPAPLMVGDFQPIRVKLDTTFLSTLDVNG